jgi:hypothetical protein
MSSKGNVSGYSRRSTLKSSLSSPKLGRRGVELLKEPDCDLRLGPLNIKAPEDTNSTLGMEPWSEFELALERMFGDFEALRSFVIGAVVSVGLVLKNEVKAL